MPSTCLSLDSAPLLTVPRELRANVFSHRWGVVVQVLIPGCGVSDVRVVVEGKILTVKAVPPSRNHGLSLICEIEQGELERAFALTPDLDVSRMSQLSADGVLTLVIPRAVSDLAS